MSNQNQKTAAAAAAAPVSDEARQVAHREVSRTDSVVGFHVQQLIEEYENKVVTLNDQIEILIGQVSDLKAQLSAQSGGGKGKPTGAS